MLSSLPQVLSGEQVRCALHISKRKCAWMLMVVHHVRKQWSDDPHQMVIGTTGIIGAADTSYVLMKEKITDDVAKFYVRGRDVEEQVLTIKFNPESKEWIFVSSNSPIADAMKNDKVISLLINFIKSRRTLSERLRN